MAQVYRAEFDASSRETDERSTIGFVIYAPGKKVLCKSRRVVEYATSVEVEFKSFIELLKALVGLGVKTVIIKGDCAAVINQVNGSQAPNKRTEDLCTEALTLMCKFEHCSVKWMPRIKNQTANNLSRKSLGMVKKK